MNNLIAHQDTNVTEMTSREIANLVNKEHYHVRRDIKIMLTELDLDESNFGCTYLDSSNRKQTEYSLNRELTDCLLTGYSAKARMAVIKRWHELERALSAPKIPTTYLEALKALVDSEENRATEERAKVIAIQRVVVAEHKIEKDAPKVAFVDDYATKGDNMRFGKVAKLLNLNARWFRTFLKNTGIMFRQGNEWAAKNQHIAVGRFVTATGTAKNGHNFTEALFTPKGITWIDSLVREEQEEARKIRG